MKNYTLVKKNVLCIFEVLALLSELITRHCSLKIWEVHFQYVQFTQDRDIKDLGVGDALAVDEEKSVDFYSVELLGSCQW